MTDSQQAKEIARQILAAPRDLRWPKPLAREFPKPSRV